LKTKKSAIFKNVKVYTSDPWYAAANAMLRYIKIETSAMPAINGAYSSWKSCSATCDGGYQYRDCNSPAPSYGGSKCAGLSKQRCNTHACPESCRMANWWKSFDKKGWSTCGSSNEYMNGLYRNGKSGGDDGLFRIEEARCCKRSGSYGSESDDCYNANWWSSFDKENNWNTCKAGYFLRGLYRNGGKKLHSLEEAKCCKPRSAPESYGHCYDQDVGSSFDKKGTSKCNKGYIMTGMYRGGCDWLYCIEKFRCCKMQLKA